MKPSAPSHRVLQDKTFLLLLITVSLAFAWILWPFYGAIFWAAVVVRLGSGRYAVVVTGGGGQ